MNAQMAVAVEAAGRRTRRDMAPEFPNLDSFGLHVDTSLGAVWITRKPESSASITIQQLRDTRTVDRWIDATPPHEIRFKVLTSGEPGVFSLGGDLAFFTRCVAEQDRGGLLEYAKLAIAAIHNNLRGHGAHALNTVALINGETQGGGFEAALSCHLIVAERGTHFGFPEPLFGMFPGMGGEVLLAARTDDAVATRIMRRANRYPAEFLHEIGVVDFVAEAGAGRSLLTQILSRAQTPGDSTAQRFAERQAQMMRVQYGMLEDSITRWTDQALRLSPRHLRTMGYILEMQRRRRRRAPGRPRPIAIPIAT